MIIAIGFSFIFVIVLIIFWRATRASEMASENKQMQLYMISMESFYEGVKERIEATRRYRHDLARHIQTLEYMMKNEQDVGVYLEDLKQRYVLSGVSSSKHCLQTIAKS